MDDSVIAEMTTACVMMRARLISRIITSLYEEELRPFGIGAPQFALLLVMNKIAPVSRAEIGRHHWQDRSTLTRNLKIILAEQWAEEIPHLAGGRARLMVVSEAGKRLLREVAPAWRAAQEKAKAVLTEEGARAVMEMANGIMARPANR